MKIKILFAIVVLPFISIAQTQNSVNVSASYHNRGCIGGTGFCSSKETISESKTPNAKIQKLDSNKVLLIINSNQFTDTELDKLVNSKIVTVSGTQNITLTRSLLSKINIDAQFSEIKTGDYPIEIINDKVQITFTLVKK